MSWQIIDKQMAYWASKLRDDLSIDATDSVKLATAVSREVNLLTPNTKKEIERSSPVSIKNRLDELIAFQGWMDEVKRLPKSPMITRAQVITQNYICFVYLKEACFYILHKSLPSYTTTYKSCSFLLSEPIRAFRNSLAHANWQYKVDYSGIEFWSREKQSAKEMIKWEVKQDELNFWQQLSRVIAYATYTTLIEGES